MSKLNSFLINLIRGRWQARHVQAGKPGIGDILDRILAAIEVRQQYSCYPVIPVWLFCNWASGPALV
jgi:hypothetical protein